MRKEIPSNKITSGQMSVIDIRAFLLGDSDPWYVTRSHGSIIDIESPGERNVYVADLLVSRTDLPSVDQALLAAPKSHELHDPEAEIKRQRSGAICMKIADSMVRARMMDEVDGWSALIDSGILIDQGEDGRLVKPDPSYKLLCNLLEVVCPSTGRRYVLRVDTKHRTAKSARLSTLGLASAPEVET